MCVLGDFNEDILMGKETHCHTKIESMGFKQMVEKPTCDSRTIIEQSCVCNKLNENCYRC